MNSTKVMCRCALACLLALTAVAGQAAIVTYTSQSVFRNGLGSYGVDGFGDISLVETTPGPLQRQAGNFAYTASSSSLISSSFFGAGSSPNPWLSTNDPSASILFNNFDASVNAIGGLFFGSDFLGMAAAGDITLVATDSTGAVATYTVVSASPSSFFGFTSDAMLTSLTVSASQANDQLWATVDDLTIGAATPVPEPSSVALLLLGLGLVAGNMRRTRRRCSAGGPLDSV